MPSERSDGIFYRRNINKTTIFPIRLPCLTSTPIHSSKIYRLNVIQYHIRHINDKRPTCLSSKTANHHDILPFIIRPNPSARPCPDCRNPYMGNLLLGNIRMSIIVENLTVSYHRRPAVHHVDITFEEHSMWAVFGPNGAGKSTFLKSLMGLQPLDTGSIRLDGLTRQNIAYLPQQSDIDRSQPMTVFDLAAMGLWYEIGFFKGINSTQKQRVHEALERVGMQRFADRQIAYLSNGQFQRVLFARMLVQNAKFLLLDEPFNAVDARTTYELLDVLQKCHCNGHAIIAVLHDYEQVRAYFPNTMLLAREKIAAGATETILTEAYLAQANAKLQKQESPDWCAS